MLRNYLLIAWRVLCHNKVFTAINIFGLAIGMAATIILFQYIWFEKSYDGFHDKSAHIYRVNLYGLFGEELQYIASNNPACGPMLKSELPEVIEYVRFFKHAIAHKACIISYESTQELTKKFNEDQEKIYYVDASIFSVFSYSLIKGNAETALKDPYTIVLSEKIAKKYFGDSDPIGKTIHVEDWTDNENKNYMVTGVMKEIPTNSHLQFDILISFATLDASIPGIGDFNIWWKWPQFYTYLLLRNGVDPKNLEKKIYTLTQDKDEFLLDIKARRGEIFEGGYELQPLRDIYLHDIANWIYKNDTEKLNFLMIVGIMIILIACINYINLSTAKGIKRAGEVGLRKVIGASKYQLISQFLTESLIINILAITGAVTVIQLIGSYFNQLVGKDIFSFYMFDVRSGGLIALIVLGSILISGCYPAIVMASFKPLSNPDSKLSIHGKRFTLRNLLVVFQFTVSILLIIGVYTISCQLSFLNAKNLGFDKTQILTLKVPALEEYNVRIESFMQEVKIKQGILNATNSNSIPGIYAPGHIFTKFNESDDQDIDAENKRLLFYSVDEDYLNTFGMELLNGRNFTDDEASDHDAVIVSKIALEKIGYAYPEEAIGSYLFWQSWPAKLRIIGVIKDYFHYSPKWGIDGIVLQKEEYATGLSELAKLKVRQWPGTYLSIKIHGDNISQTIQSIQKDWESSFPEVPFDYLFVDDQYKLQHGADQNLGDIFSIFSFVAVIIACLGLFGLTLYSTIQCTKEIGIRKVMGAPTLNILKLLTKESFVLMMIASVIAIPIAYWRIDAWLSNFANRIDITPGLFIIPIVMVLLIAVVTVSYQTIKAATEKPVKALRYE